MPKIFCVHVKFPCGFEHDVNIMPGSPVVFPNRAQAAKDPKPRAIATMDDAIEFASGAFQHQTSPVSIEWPAEVTAVCERDSTAEDHTAARAVLKRLACDPGKEGK